MDAVCTARSGVGRAFTNKPLLLFTAAQGITNLGDTMRFIAVTSLLVKVTGSGLSAGLGVVFSLLPAFLLSLFAGSAGDIVLPKRLLILFELVRSAIIILFINTSDAALIYLLLAALSAADTLYNPPARKMMLAIIGQDGLVFGNSVLSGVLGATSIIGSCAAGASISAWGTGWIFLINCYSHIISAVLILVIKPGKACEKAADRAGSSWTAASAGMKTGFRYLRGARHIREFIITNAVISFGAVSINMAFYPFAFDVLRVTELGWGVMMSVFYGTSMLAMAVSLYINKWAGKMSVLPVYVMTIVLAAVWLGYAKTENLMAVLLLQLVEGTALLVCNIFLVSRMQHAAGVGFVARITGISDFVASVGKIIGVTYAYTVIRLFSVRQVFLINSLILSAYTACMLLYTLPRRSRAK